MLIYIIFLLPGYAFLQFMDHGEDRIWHCSNLQRQCVRVRKLIIYNHGRLSRDFTYIDDIVEGIMRIQSLIPGNTTINSIEPNQMNKNNISHRLYNIGYGKPVELMTFIKVLEKELGIKAKINFTDMQQGDVHATWADTTALFSATGYQPQVDIETGIRRFVKWYKSFYHI